MNAFFVVYLFVVFFIAPRLITTTGDSRSLAIDRDRFQMTHKLLITITMLARSIAAGILCDIIDSKRLMSSNRNVIVEENNQKQKKHRGLSYRYYTRCNNRTIHRSRLRKSTNTHRTRFVCFLFLFSFTNARLDVAWNAIFSHR